MMDRYQITSCSYFESVEQYSNDVPAISVKELT